MCIHTFAAGNEAGSEAIPVDEQKGYTMQHDRYAELRFSDGTVSIKVTATGNADDITRVVDPMLATATAVTGIEVVRYGIFDGTGDEGNFDHKVSSSVRFGETNVTIELGFESKKEASKNLINAMIFKDILPETWQTAGLYLGDYQLVDATPTPFARRLPGDTLASIDSVLSLPGYGAFGLEPLGSPAGGHRRRRFAR